MEGLAEIRDRAADACARLATVLDDDSASDGLDAYTAAARGAAGRSYQRLAPRLLELERWFAAARQGGAAAANRWLTARLAAEFDPGDAPIRLPESVLAQYPIQLARVVAQLDRLGDGHYALSSDAFVRDLGILTLRLFPCGDLFADPHARVAASIAVRRGLRQFTRFVRTFGVQSRGLRPFLALHLHNLAIDHFTEEQCVPTHLRAVEILEANPGLRGIVGASWLVDPRLEAVSPHLGFLVRVTLEAGGSIFYVRDEGAESLALETSRKRRGLFEAGAYTPEVWLRAIPRSAALDWVRRERGIEGVAAGRG